MSTAESNIYLTQPRARVVEWKPWTAEGSGNLYGYCTAEFCGIQINRIPIFKGDDGLTVGVPTAAILDRNGTVAVRDGRKQYQTIITFADAAARKRWQSAIAVALWEARIGKPTLSKLDKQPAAGIGSAQTVIDRVTVSAPPSPRRQPGAGKARIEDSNIPFGACVQ
jgi:hypothetical protein